MRKGTDCLEPQLLGLSTPTLFLLSLPCEVVTSPGSKVTHR